MDLNAERGTAAEVRVLDILRSMALPWALDVQHAERLSPADQAGLDILVTTDRGVIGIQVKSSRRATNAFRQRARARGELDRIAVISVRSVNGFTLSDETLSRELAAKLESAYLADGPTFEGLSTVAPPPRPRQPPQPRRTAKPLTVRPFAGLWPSKT